MRQRPQGRAGRAPAPGGRPPRGRPPRETSAGPVASAATAASGAGAPGGLAALDANLAATAVDVVIPEEHRVLLDIASEWFGIRRGTEELLREVHHRYASWAQTLTDVHRRATGDFHYYNRHARGPEALAIYSDIYARIAEQADDAAARPDAVRLWLQYLELLSTRSGDRKEENLAVLEAALRRMEPLVHGSPELAAAASSRLRRLAGRLASRASAGARERLDEVLGLLATALDHVYRAWIGRDDPAEWYRDITSSATGAPLPEPVARITHARLDAHLHELRALVAAGGRLRDRARQLVGLPDDRELVNAHLEAARSVGGESETPEALLARIHWLLHLLEAEALTPVHEPALREVNRLCSRLIAGGERPHALVHEIFGLLRRARLPRTRAVHELVGSLGALAVASGDPDLIEALVEEMLDLDFDYPEFSGFTPDWGVRVSPAHLRGIRMYLRMIEADPLTAAPLTATLVVHLRLGGVLVLDTDLVQRDISSLLGRDIAPVYLLAKQLLRLFPVYFNEIGAEGELRRTTTRLDDIEERRDPLCHFLRKQSHVDCNPLLASLAEEAFRYWATGDPAPLRRYLPEAVEDELLASGGPGSGLQVVARRLAGTGGGVDGVLSLGPDAIDAALADLEGADPMAAEKVSLIFRVREELRRKYALDHTDVIARLRRFGRVDAHLIATVEEALGRDDHQMALDAVLSVLEGLQEIILSPGPVDAVEDIYHKRHIAAGIPSMYGSYREARFEAVGLTFRLESLAGGLLERVIADGDLADLDREGLRSVARWLHLLLRALRVDGFRAQGLAHCLSLLDQAIGTESVTVDQYINVFQLASRSVETLVRARILDAYEEPARHVIGRMIERGVLAPPPGDGEWAVLKASEAFLRDLIAESLGLQRLDVLVGRVLRALTDRRRDARWRRRPPAAPVDLDSAIVPFGAGARPGAGIMSLGNKGFMLARLIQLGIRVPAGFALTTELVRHVEFGDPGGVPAPVLARVGEQIGRLERATGLSFGDPGSPLLLSVRGGAPISMPGMLESLLNVGINEEIAEGMAARERCAWAAWDAYRRFLQFWGMSHGLGRQLFDSLMTEAKQRHGVPKKHLLAPSQMRELALRYRTLIRDHGLEVIDDPSAQLLACIELVRRSWHSENARLYRRALHIAEEWETAVLVQCMVFGNLDGRSGTGVMLTRHPHHASIVREPYGDFVVQGQGDDVVAGLVETHPITETQRRRESRGSPMSLEAGFPAVYAELTAMARALVERHGMNHQEVEFTFEGPRPEDLFILQTRDTVLASGSLLPAFEPTPELESSRIATGVGVGAGALSGRVAHTAHDVTALRESSPRDPIILVRRDTVPDDIPLMLRVDGLLTSLGGATSHAAVAAKRVGKTCVVGCRALEVSGSAGPSRIGGRSLATGDRLSIDGMDGSVYLGAHPLAAAPVRGRAQQ